MTDSRLRTCDEIEDLLIRQYNSFSRTGNQLRSDGDPLRNEEMEDLQSHLKACDACRQYNVTLQAVNRVTPETTVTPSPDIPGRIKQRMSEKQIDDPAEEATQDKAVRRIPVYQVILAAAAVLVLTFMGLNASSTIHQKNAGPETGVSFADTSRIMNQDSLPGDRTVRGDSLPAYYNGGIFDTLRTVDTQERL